MRTAAIVIILCWVGHSQTVYGQDEDRIDFDRQIQPIFTMNCALSGCHLGPGAAASQDLSEGQAYDALVEVASRSTLGFTRVIPGNPEESLLVRKMEGDDGVGLPMPPNGMIVAQQFADLVRLWIAQGALRDPRPTAVTPIVWSGVKARRQ